MTSGKENNVNYASRPQNECRHQEENMLNDAPYGTQEIEWRWAGHVVTLHHNLGKMQQ